MKTRLHLLSGRFSGDRYRHTYQDISRKPEWWCSNFHSALKRERSHLLAAQTPTKWCQSYFNRYSQQYFFVRDHVQQDFDVYLPPKGGKYLQLLQTMAQRSGQLTTDPRKSVTFNRKEAGWFPCVSDHRLQRSIGDLTSSITRSYATNCTSLASLPL